MSGLPIRGTWSIEVLDVSAQRDSRFSVDGRLLDWGFRAEISGTPPKPTFVFGDWQSFSQSINSNLVWARGFHETVNVDASATTGLNEIATYKGQLIGDPTESQTFTKKENSAATIGHTLTKQADLGSKILEISATSGEVSRIKVVDVEIVEPDRQHMELLSHVSLPELGATLESGSDIWGWQDPMTGTEIALMTTSNGTTFVDVTDPKQPIVLGQLLTHTDSSNWRDVKVYQNYAYVVSEAEGHGLQVFDLTQLRTISTFTLFETTTHVADFGQAHNIVINDESGFAYVVGAQTNDCSGGLLIYDLSNPAEPHYQGCFGGGVPQGQLPSAFYSTDIYTHDAQCLIYRGPDLEHQGQEICLTSDEASVGIVDLSNKASPRQLSRFTYPQWGTPIKDGYQTINDIFW